jgi:23S rRNA (cytidine1920-2'-O)/16S rRNA (cytidine1409-2'-O)-methyltransferase
LDELLLHLGYAKNLKHARALIGAGEVYINDERADKAGLSYNLTVSIRLKSKIPYVSRGGLKLKGSLDYFSIDVKGAVCADIGASTGGFTDCLLQHGAQKVYAIDVAYGQLDWKLRQDERVVVLERFNARNITKKQVPEYIDLAAIDASFISLQKLIPPLLPLFKEKISIIALIKPQFEIAKGKIGQGGVVREKKFHDEVIDATISFLETMNLKSSGVTESPITGPKGNKEFLIYITN